MLNANAKCKMLYAKCLVRNAKCQMLNAKCYMSNAKCVMICYWGLGWYFCMEDRGKSTSVPP